MYMFVFVSNRIRAKLTMIAECKIMSRSQKLRPFILIPYYADQFSYC